MRSVLPGVAMVLALSACATHGAVYSDTHAAPVAADYARLYMYRESSIVGSGVQPSVLLDGVKVRDSVPGSYTMLDILPGPHALTAETETEKHYNFTAAPRQEIFVREAPGAGWLVGRIHLEPVSAENAADEISTLHAQTLAAK